VHPFVSNGALLRFIGLLRQIGGRAKIVAIFFAKSLPANCLAVHLVYPLMLVAAIAVIVFAISYLPSDFVGPL